MAKEIENPFIVTGYESPEYFCDREKETQDLLLSLRNGNNVVLASPRKMGKTGLILHLFHQIKKAYPKAVVIYVDLFLTEDLASFTHLFASKLLGSLDSNPERILKRISTFLKGIRPVLTLDEMTGAPKFGVDFDQGEERHTLAQLFEGLRESGKECFIAFDEFQQIANYPEKNVEAILRSHIQNIHNAHFIFSGSQTHLLSEMFLSARRPFYQSASHRTIGPIEEAAYAGFAASFFKKQGRALSEGLFHQLYWRYEGHTWYIQKVLNQLYKKKDAPLDESTLNEAILDILKETEYYYQMMLRAYSPGQVKLLKAIAREGVVKEITAGSFIAKNGLTATSSVKSALKRLLEDEVVYLSDRGYIIYDRFFGEWMALSFTQR